jgi:hypothetical protein
MPLNVKKASEKKGDLENQIDLYISGYNRSVSNLSELKQV